MSSQTSSSSLVSGETAKHSPRAVPSWRWAALLVGVVTLTFPPLAAPVHAGLDPSWVIGLHEALERGLVFGRDIGFTYGPLGHMFYPLNKGTPLTISTLLLLTLYTTWWISVALVMAQLRGNAKVSLFVVGTVASGMISQQHFCTTYIPLLTTAGFLVGAHVSRQSWWAVPGVILTAVGLLSKFNIGVACLGSFLAYLALSPLRVGTRRALLQGVLLIGLHVAALGHLNPKTHSA